MPNITAADGELPRTYALVTDEYDGQECPHGVKSRVYMFDIHHESHPMPLSTWQVPIGNFCDIGGNFGPHQHAETVNGQLNRFEDKRVWIAYLNAGVRGLCQVDHGKSVFPLAVFGDRPRQQAHVTTSHSANARVRSRR